MKNRLSPGQARVLLYLQENACNGECYRYVGEIAETVKLTRSYVTKVTSDFVKWGIISREQMWDVLVDGDVNNVKLVPAAVAELNIGYAPGQTDDEYHPAGNHYKILQPAAAKALVDGSLCKPTQLELPFGTAPPFELTILAPRARFWDPKIDRPKIELVGVGR